MKRPLDIQTISLPEAVHVGVSAVQAIEKLKRGHIAKDEFCLKQLKEIALTAMGALHELSERNEKKTVEAFVVSVTQSVQRLIDAQRKCPKHFRELAKTANCWPGFLTVDYDWRNLNQNIIRDLQLGQSAKVNYQGKPWTRRTLEVKIALELLEASAWALKHNASRDPNDRESPIYDVAAVKRLKPLSRKNYKDWWKAHESQFLHRYGNDFENHKRFAQYWRNETYKGETNVRALIRRDIKKRIKQAFHTIAPKPLTT